MKLKPYLDTMDPIDRKEFAINCGTTIKHLSNVAYGYKPCGERLAVAIERNSSKAVTRKTLRPNDWQDIWPELATSPPE